MPDMREEFEAFAKKHHESDWLSHGRKLFAFLPGTEEYDFAFIEADWQTWQASRAALKVELPAERDETFGNSAVSEYQATKSQGFNDCLALVEEALQQAGIEVAK